MAEPAKQILYSLEEYLKQNPTVRFSQALFNLGIVEFADKHNPEAKNHLLRDIYNDSDECVLEKITKKIQ